MTSLPPPGPGAIGQSGNLANDEALRVAYEGKRALVTGGLGFIGSNLVRALHELGCYVGVIDNLAPDLGGNRYNVHGIEREVEVFIGDIRDEKAIRDAVRERDFIFHIAGTGSHLDSLEKPFQDLEINAVGTMCVLEATRRESPAAAFVYAGTRSEYGAIRTSPVSEDHPLLPTEPNSANKAAAGLQTIAYHQAFGLQTVWLRLTNIYGPRMLVRQHAGMGFMNWFVRLAVDGGSIRLYGDGSQVRDMVYVDDCVRAFLLAGVTPEAAGEALNVGSGAPASLATIAQTLIDTTGRGSIECVPFPDEAKRIEIGDYVADTSKIERLLGWRAEVGLKDGIERTVRFFEEHKDTYW